MNTKLTTKKITDTKLTIEQPANINNFFYYFAGIGIHIVNKIRHELQGYTSARGFSSQEIEKAVQHDHNIVTRWKDYIEQYQLDRPLSMNGKNVLELGPGADLGVGLLTLLEGASNYYSMDVHNLALSSSTKFYDSFFSRAEKEGYSRASINELKNQLELTLHKKSDRLNYLVKKDFDLNVFEGKDIDLVLSNAAFQQFDDPAKTIAQLTKVVRPGALFVSLIDLKTHTRWIKTRDPLNIYRYSDQLYNLFRFKGIQNRIRPFQFQEMLEKNGWKNVKIYSRHQLVDEYVAKVNPTLQMKFQDKMNSMSDLTVVICAEKA